MARRRQPRKGHIPAIEWVVGAIALAIVAALLGVIAYDAVAHDGGAPSLRVSVASVDASRVVVSVDNDGDRAAADVTVEGIAGGARSEARLDYLAGRSRREATLVFPAPPRPEDVKLRVLGYTVP